MTIFHVKTKIKASTSIFVQLKKEKQGQQYKYGVPKGIVPVKSYQKIKWLKYTFIVIHKQQKQ